MIFAAVCIAGGIIISVLILLYRQRQHRDLLDKQFYMLQRTAKTQLTLIRDARQHLKEVEQIEIKQPEDFNYIEGKRTDYGVRKPISDILSELYDDKKEHK